MKRWRWAFSPWVYFCKAHWSGYHCDQWPAAPCCDCDPEGARRAPLFDPARAETVTPRRRHRPNPHAMERVGGCVPRGTMAVKQSSQKERALTWAWLSWAIVVERAGAEVQWHADPFSGDELLIVDAQWFGYDVGAFIRGGVVALLAWGSGGAAEKGWRASSTGDGVKKQG